MGIQKGQALLFEFPMYDSTTGLLKSGLTCTATISKDGSAFASSANSVVEVGGGIYSLQLTAAEMNASTVVVKVTASGALTLTACLYPPESVWDEAHAEHKDPASFGGQLSRPVRKAVG